MKNIVIKNAEVKCFFNYELHHEKQDYVSLHDMMFMQPLFTLVAIQVLPVDIFGDAIVSAAGSWTQIALEMSQLKGLLL